MEVASKYVLLQRWRAAVPSTPCADDDLFGGVSGAKNDFKWGVLHYLARRMLGVCCVCVCVCVCYLARRVLGVQRRGLRQVRHQLPPHHRVRAPQARARHRLALALRAPVEGRSI